MKLLNEASSFSFPQVFIIGIVLAVLLKILTGLIWLGLATINPTHLHQNAQSLPWPVLILGGPVLLAALIIAFSGPKWERNTTAPQTGHITLTPETEAVENQRLFAPRFTPRQVFNIIKVILLIWLVILATQLVGWFAFSSYST